MRFFFIIFFIIFQNNNSYTREINYIAHAGGEINGTRYTNSLDAVKQSIILGYKFIEIDLHLSSDGYFYGFHDFTNSLILKNEKDSQIIYNFKNKFNSHNITKNDLILLNKKLKYPLILEEDIVNIFNSNTELNLVTDKTQNFKELNDKFKFMNSRLYIEITTKKSYLKSLFYPFENKIFLTPTFNFIDRFFVRLFKIKKVVFHKDLLNMEVVKKRLKKYKKNYNIDLFIYTVNAEDNLTFYSEYSDFIYTDNILLKNNNNLIK